MEGTFGCRSVRITFDHALVTWPGSRRDGGSDASVWSVWARPHPELLIINFHTMDEAMRYAATYSDVRSHEW